MNARLRRISSDYEEIKKQFANHKNILVEPIGEEPAEKYRVTYYLNGIYRQEDGSIQTLDKHIVIITLHAEYPRYKPICTIATPIWHPNFRDGQICIGDIWGAGESLSDIIINIGDMIQYKSWNSFSPLSAEAAEWAIENKQMFPVGNINLWTGEEEDGSVKKDFDIDLMDEEENTPSVEEDLILQAAEGNELSSNYTGEASESANSQQSQTDTGANYKNESENDFEITAEELQGIEFVPTAERMQGSRYGATAKGKKLNFKTVLVKGLLWALIGAIFGFGLSELFSEKLGDSAVAKMKGYTHLAEYYEYSEKADDEFDKIWAGYENYCRQNGLNPDGEESFEVWMYEFSDEYDEQWTAYFEYDEMSDAALYSSFEEEFNSDEEKLGKAIQDVGRTETAIWSAIIALLLGLFLGIGEGVYYGSKENAAKYAIIGAGISIVIGALSGYLAQWMYSSMLTDDATEMTKAFVRALGWAVMGGGIGLGIGLIKPNGKRVLSCALGGVIGAFIGGFLFNYICDMIPNDIVARGSAIIIMGLLIGVGVGILEQFAKSAWLKVVRGEFEGKEYLVFEGLTSIGNSGKNTIVLFKDKLVAPNHCDIVQEGNKYVLVDKGTPMGTVVNGMRITRHVLRQGDSIAIGNSVLVFNTK